MSKLLIINAHPDFDSTTSASLDVFNYFLKVYKEKHSNDEVIEQINLYDDEVPALDKNVLSAWSKLAEEKELTSKEKEVTDRMNTLLKQFKSANKYVIVFPMHNFSIPSKLKDYIDNVMIARETFKYISPPMSNGRASVGLLNDGRSVVTIQASGSIYTNNDFYAELEFTNKFLKSMFDLMGIEDFEAVRIQGTAFLDRDEVLQKGYKDAEEQALRLAGK
ncbi:NAD(P)H-dependent oxidoreductase [Paenibacillus chondroitinus]|uniref:FMN dependent NADH:quinone oxidoreductase n=1 Tax=Paenibacillus chondroitinus TaxID=59842 RepID=A0ABU6DIE0_9BACL|nr:MULTISPECIES: NAD(P)H-dependent oxidoreductase [Paenibacillus]MCY9657752.1 NAD(P)H-dependent oxidoreductase [Paenibacillus anseongense]MEB4797519.1 NAD(P)H-dependent oxidoreductase [Paenibacillus chondroitinus]